LETTKPPLQEFSGKTLCLFFVVLVLKVSLAEAVGGGLAVVFLSLAEVGGGGLVESVL